jgi:hypothetical protein
MRTLQKDRIIYDGLWETNYGNENEQIIEMETYWESK